MTELPLDAPSIDPETGYPRRIDQESTADWVYEEGRLPSASAASSRSPDT
ncbi:hypothetical protein [Marinactinospora rubrisoli]|uniref:Uncharacterized protein n=1 Tax=Marinactinospora rubrisoli TaxID=2715399 RepID=A0ABW2KQ15_9ACTN